MSGLHCVVLAAGLGTRMRSGISKVLHPLNGRPMLQWVLSCLAPLRPRRVIVVANRSNLEPLRRSVSAEAIEFVVQRKPLGTAHAVITATRHLGEFQGDLMILNGDTPLLRSDTLRAFLRRHRRASNNLSIISFVPEDPTGYGRVLRDAYGRPVEIREERDLSDDERAVREVNSGVYLMDERVIPLLKRIKKNPDKGEYYLTDILSLAEKRGLKVGVYTIGEPSEFIGINTKEELLRAQRILRLRKVRELVEADVHVMDEERVYASEESSVGEGTLLYPDVYIEGTTTIGRNCVIHQNVKLVDCVIGDNVVIRENSTLEGASVEEGATVGPFARLRPGTEVKRGARVGNFVEVKNSTVGPDTKALHLSYLGDAEIGSKVNIGAGTITCNYDGIKKYRTIIEDGVFVGSDTQLVAPVRIRKGAYIGAGSTITKDVPEGALALSRCEQRVIKGWVKKRFKRRGS